MNWICGANVQTNSSILIGYQYRIVDPKTKQIHSEILFDENSFQLQKYDAWRRIKIQTLDTVNLIKNLKQRKDNYIDPSFPQNNTVLSKDYFQQTIEWRRVRDVVENAVYSKQQTLKNLQKTKLNRKEFERALILISRSSPTLFKELLSKTLNPEGIYQYKLFWDGYIRNVVIDDFIPIHQGFPIFVGPARQNQVYPMLLEKAIAKVCGNYESIPQSTQQILQIIFCGPVKRQNIPNLREKQKLGQCLIKSVKQRFLTVLISKRDEKIRNYGLNDNQVYLLINNHSVEISHRKQIVYQLLSQTKLSAWNGKFSLNDSVWNEVESSKKFELYQHIKNNRSFFMMQVDIAKHFQEILIFQSMDINNKQWCQNQSNNNFPSFTSFQVTQKQKIFLRVTTKSKIRQTIILAKKLQLKNYEFIASYFNQKTYTADLSVELQQGTYIIAVYHEWFISNAGKYFVFLSSEQHINLKKGGLVDNHFLSKILIHYDLQLSQSQPQSNKLYKMRMQIQKLGLAWLIIRQKLSKSKSIKVDINHQLLTTQNWKIQQPYDEIPTINFTDKNTDVESIIILKKSQIDIAKKYHFPVAAFKLKE